MLSGTMVKTFSIILTEQDKDICAWINMLIAGNQSPRQWIQAILIAHENGLNLDAGCVSLKEETRYAIEVPAESFMIFDNDNKNEKKYQYSWTNRGPHGKYIPGSILNITITRSAVAMVIQNIKQRGLRVSPYVKAILRLYFQVSKDNETQLPDKLDAANILSTNGINAEYGIAEHNTEKNHRIPKTYKTERYRLYHPEEAKHGQKPKNQKRQDASLQEDNHEKKESSIQQNQQNRKKNPLLNYIN